MIGTVHTPAAPAYAPVLDKAADDSASLAQHAVEQDEPECKTDDVHYI